MKKAYRNHDARAANGDAANRGFQWTVGKRLTFSFLLMAVLMAAVGSISLYNLKQLADRSENVLQKHQQLLTRVASVVNDVLFHSIKVEQYVNTGNNAHLRIVETLGNNIEDHLAALRQETRNTADEAAMAALIDAYETYMNLSRSLRNLYDNPTGNLGQVRGKQMRIAAVIENRLLIEASGFYDAKTRQTRRMADDTRRLYENAFNVTLAASAALTLMGLVLSLLIRRSISTPIGQLVQTTQQVARGDLAITAPVVSNDEIGTLAMTFNTMTGKLRLLVDELEARVERRTRELREERNFVSAILETAETLVVVLDGGGRIVRFNAACEKLSGYAGNEVVGRYLWDFLTPDAEVERVKTVFATLQSGRFPFKHDNRWRTRSGQTRMIAWSNSCLADEDGRVTYVIGSGIDITDRIANEQALKQAKSAAEAANRSKSAFLAMMSHEIRTPLNGVIAMAGLLNATELDNEQRDFVKTMRSSAAALLAIINDVLDFSKIEAGKLDLEKIPFDLTHPIEEVMRIFQDKARRKGLAFNYSVAPDVCRSLVGDPVRLKQILGNLIANAIKFTEQGEVAVQVIRESDEGTRARLRFSIVDTGIGIPRQSGHLLFKPFSQVDASTTRRFGGTGLGLSIAKLLCEMMAGVMGMHSQPGKGSTFWFTALFDKQKEACRGDELSDSEPKASAPWRSRTSAGYVSGSLVRPSALGPAPLPVSEKDGAPLVLLVEDNETNKKVAAHILKKRGCAIEFAENGEQAVAAFTHGRFDIIFMDVQMPVMDGLAATQRIRALEAEGDADSRIPIVALTANAMKNDRDVCLAAGMDDYLAKPINPEQVWEKLDKWIGNRPLGR